VLVIDCSAVIDVEYTALKVLEQLDDKLRRSGCELWFAGMTRGVFDVVERSGIGSRIGHERMFLNLQAAVETYERTGGYHEAIEDRAAGQGREAPHQA
jgi:anti-anti-sigma regulatory factor